MIPKGAHQFAAANKKPRLTRADIRFLDGISAKSHAHLEAFGPSSSSYRLPGPCNPGCCESFFGVVVQHRLTAVGAVLAFSV